MLKESLQDTESYYGEDVGDIESNIKVIPKQKRGRKKFT